MSDELEIETLVATGEQLAKLEQIEEFGFTIGTGLWKDMVTAFDRTKFKLKDVVERGVAAAAEARIVMRRRDRYDLLMQAEATDVAALVVEAEAWVGVVKLCVDKLIAEGHPKAKRLDVVLRAAEELRDSARASELVVARVLDACDVSGVGPEDFGLEPSFFLGAQMIVDRIPVDRGERIAALRNRMSETLTLGKHLDVVDECLLKIGREVRVLRGLKVEVPGVEMQILRASRGRAGGPRPVPAPAPAPTPAPAPMGSGLPPLDPEGEG